MLGSVLAAVGRHPITLSPPSSLLTPALPNVKQSALSSDGISGPSGEIYVGGGGFWEGEASFFGGSPHLFSAFKLKFFE